MTRFLKKILKVGVCVFILFFPAFAIAEQITVVGIGRLGLSIALSLEKAGYEVLGVDISQEYIDLINTKTLSSSEPKITEYLQESVKFRATTSLKEGLEFSDICLIALSTTTGTDDYHFEPLSDLLSEINSFRIQDKHIVICSTVMPGYIRNVAKEKISECENVVISYNPPFIAQGAIIEGYTEPDMILIGEGSEAAGNFLESLHEKVSLNTPYIARMSVNSAEIAKLALNSFITFKIAYANLIGDIADETPDTDKYDILNAIGMDSRVGSKYLKPGYGFGGPCFPRDNRALSCYAQDVDLDATLFLAIDKANEQHAENMARKLFDQNLEVYVFQDVSYKSNSPVKIIEQSQKLNVAKKLAEQGKKVLIVDGKKVIEEVKEKYQDLFLYAEE